MNTPLSQPSQQITGSRRIGFLVYSGCEILDVCGPYDVFFYADTWLTRFGRSEIGYQCVLIAAAPGPIRTKCGIDIAPTQTFDDAGDKLDTLIVAGGCMNVEEARSDPTLIEWVRSMAPRTRRVASICTGAFILAAAGLLNHRRVTTHWMFSELLATTFPLVRVDSNPLFCRDGNIYSSGGITAEIDLALALLEEDLGQPITLTVARTTSGGKVLGHVLYPLNSPDFSSFLLQAQSSKAKIVALANAGQDTVNSVKQAAEFGIVGGGQRLAALLVTLAEVHGLGLQAAQGLVLTESYYWDLNDRTRELGERFFKRTGRMPSMIQAGTYSATLQYLKAVKAAGTRDADAVAKKLKELPVDDAFTSHGHVQANGRMVSDLYLFEVKKPSESKRDWDYYNLLATVPGDTAYPTAAKSGCPLTK